MTQTIHYTEHFYIGKHRKLIEASSVQQRMTNGWKCVACGSKFFTLHSSFNIMQDFDELKQIKAQCIADIREALPRYSERLDAIDPRLNARLPRGECVHSELCRFS